MPFRALLSSASLALFALAAVGCSHAVTLEPGAAGYLVSERYTLPGRYTVETSRGVWQDSSRSREIPWLIRYPLNTEEPRPVMIFSHGLGGSREGLARMSQFLASHGYVIVHVQHKGSDTAIWRGVRPDPATADRSAMLDIATDPAVLLNRFADIPFALTQLGAMNNEGEMQGRFDMNRVAMSGHSFGAVTTQVMAGQVFPGGASMPAEGFRAFVAMSPSGDRNGEDKAAFAGVSQPFLMMTGTEDSFALNPSVQSAEDRLRPYYALPESLPAVLVNLNGGDHFVFSGQALTQGTVRPMDERHHQIIDAAVLAFLDTFLLDDPEARNWIISGLPELAQDDAQIDWRNLNP